MSRFVNGFSESNARLNSAPVLTTGGTTSGVISTSVTPTGNAVATKAQADTLGSGSGGPSTNGVNVYSLIAGQVTPTAWYGFSSTNTGNFTVPTGVTRIFAQVWGGGGGGGGPSCKQLSESGGAGGYAHGAFTVQAGDVICAQAGRGGCRGCCPRHGFDGVISYVCNATRGIQLRAYPGGGGRCNMVNYQKGSGSSGQGQGGTLCVSGQCKQADGWCSCHKWTCRMRATMDGVGGFIVGGFMSVPVGITAAMCTSAVCGMGNPSPGGGGAGTGVGYPTSNKGGNGGPGLVMIWY